MHMYRVWRGSRFGRQLVPPQGTSEDPPERSSSFWSGLECPRAASWCLPERSRAFQSTLEHPIDIVLDAVQRGARGVGSFRCGVELQGRVSRLRCCADGQRT